MQASSTNPSMLASGAPPHMPLRCETAPVTRQSAPSSSFAMITTTYTNAASQLNLDQRISIQSTMDSNIIDEERRHQEEEEEEMVVEVPEMNGELLVELLDASLAAVAAEEEADDGEAAARRKQQQQQLGFFTADVGDGWDGQKLMNSIHPHQEEGCEDCGLDDIFSDFDARGYPAPPFANVDDPVEFWMEEMDQASSGPFAGECPGEWYMDGMAMEWEDGRSYYSFHYPSYGGGDACTDQLYSSPLWE